MVNLQIDVCGVVIMWGGVPTCGLSRFLAHLEHQSMIHKNEQLCPLQGWGEKTLKPWIGTCKCFHVVHGCNYNVPTLMLGCGWCITNRLFWMT